MIQNLITEGVAVVEDVVASGDEPQSDNTIKGGCNTVIILAPPMAECKPGVQSWRDAAAIAAEYIESRYGKQISVEFVEMFSPDSFLRPELLNIVERDTLHLPVVFIDNRVITSGGKIDLSAIWNAIEQSGIKRPK